MNRARSSLLLILNILIVVIIYNQQLDIRIKNAIISFFQTIIISNIIFLVGKNLYFNKIMPNILLVVIPVILSILFIIVKRYIYNTIDYSAITYAIFGGVVLLVVKNKIYDIKFWNQKNREMFYFVMKIIAFRIRL